MQRYESFFEMWDMVNDLYCPLTKRQEEELEGEEYVEKEKMQKLIS